MITQHFATWRQPMRVLMIEDDVMSNGQLTQALRDGGAVVDRLDSGEEALAMVRHYDFDIVLLDLVLADMDGYEVVRRMRAARVDTPVLIMSALVRPQARVKAFAMGADDVISKPYDVGECVARMQAIVRRSKGYSQPVLRLGQVELSLETREVSVAGKPVRLTGKEYSILELLVMRKGMVLTKDVFLNHLYGGMDEPEVKIIDVFICKLRKKLAEAGARDVIGTVWGRGYTVREPGTGAVPALAQVGSTASAFRHEPAPMLEISQAA
jgi:two-component system cell cycle response regulator CtrA